MYRPQIKVVDATIRDGGLVNDHQFDHATVGKVYKACSDAGIDYMEIGYRASKKQFDSKKFGPWKFSSDQDVWKAVGEKTKTKICAMIDVGRVEEEDIAPASESPIDGFRIATYVKDVDRAIALENMLHDKGYETFINVMALSQVKEIALDEALQQMEEETKITACYVVDSFGNLYSEEIDWLVEKFQKFLKTKEIGIHCHNNQQLAFANTIEAIIKNCNYLDSTIYGMGRGAGNCPTELLIAFLKNPKYSLKPILDILQEIFVPLKEKEVWGYQIPYMITGVLNEHPRNGINLVGTPEWLEFRKLYEELISEKRSD